MGFSTTPIVYTAGEIDVTTPVSFLSVTGSTTFSLPAGTIGQIKMLVCTVAASTPVGVLTPVASANDGYGTITFNEVGESVTLIYENSGWIVISRTTPSQVDSTGPTSAGTSASFSAGSGFGYRRKVLTLGSGNDDNTLTLTAADSGSIIFVTPTNAVTLILPLVGAETGIWFDIIMADKINKAFLIKTSGQDGADNISVLNQLTAATGTTTTSADVGAADHDILTFTNALEGSRIELINVQGGAAELWHAYVRSLDTVVATIA